MHNKWHILHIHWTDFVSNDGTRYHTRQSLLSDTICQRRLSFFGHLCLATPVKTILELFRPAFGVLPKTGNAEPVDRGKPGWERLRMICAHSISASQMARRCAFYRSTWRQLMEAASPAMSTWHALERERDNKCACQLLQAECHFCMPKQQYSVFV